MHFITINVPINRYGCAIILKCIFQNVIRSSIAKVCNDKI